MATLSLAQHERVLREPAHDQVVVLEGLSWSDYERVLKIRGEKGRPRLAYLEGRLEIMSPSINHEVIKSTIGRLVEVWCEEHNIHFSACGSWTLKDKSVERGVEPDECYVFKQLENLERIKRPDLAIEVEWSAVRLDKLDVYRKLGVRELWIWKRDGRIEIYVLRGRQYRAVAASKVLRGIRLDVLVSFIPLQTSQAMRSYRDEIRRKGTK